MQARIFFHRFLQSRRQGGATHMTQAQPKDIVAFMCWLDSSGKCRRTTVHGMHCTAVGTDDLKSCSTEEGACARRYAHDSFRSNHVSKIAVAYDRDMGVATGWCDRLRVGNPVRRDLVTQYMAFTRSEQKRAGVLVKQAPALLHSHLESIIRLMQQELRATINPLQKLRLARNIALFTVVFSTTKRGDELTRTLIQRMLILPNRCAFMSNFQWGKTLRDGADHLITIPYEQVRLATCPIRAVEQWIAVGTHAGWDMTEGSLLPQVLEGADGLPKRGSFFTAPQMTVILKQYSAEARENQDFSMHSFSSGGAVSLV
ncbi:unnamed protein product [Laminaria digitata]